jgi:Cu/Ag efflux pump CusA
MKIGENLAKHKLNFLMKRIAAPMVGGTTLSVIMELTIYPAIFFLWKGRVMRKRNTD